jgi:hypothetical protein
MTGLLIANVEPMSALPPIADILGHGAVGPQKSFVGLARTTLVNSHRNLEGMTKSQQRWKARRGLSSFSCCAMAVWLPLNSANAVTNSSAPLSHETRTLSSV